MINPLLLMAGLYVEPASAAIGTGRVEDPGEAVARAVGLRLPDDRTSMDVGPGAGLA